MASTVLQASTDVTIEWDSSCFSTDQVDIYLYSYASSSLDTTTGMIQGWKGVANSGGSYNAGGFSPAWWNNTADASLNILISEGNSSPFTAGVPGPIFTIQATSEQLATATSQPAAVTQTKTAADGSITTTTDSDGLFQTAKLEKPPGLAKGAMAAAIVVPVVVVGILVGLYIKFARMREREKRKRWSEHVDRRMSTISGDWRSGGGSTAGGPGGVRSSMISNGTRATSVYFSNGDARGSIYSVAPDNNMAGAGAGGAKRIPRVGLNSTSGSEMRQSQLRQSVFNASTTDVRQSRISFADDVRKSRVSFSDVGGPLRPTKSNLSGLANNGMGARRPVSHFDGERHSIDNSRLASARLSSKLDDETEFVVSPTQASGPFTVPSSRIPPVPALPEKKAGLFSALSSAVGLKDKKGSGPEEDVDRVPALHYTGHASTHNGENQHAGDDNGMEQIAGDTDDQTYLAANAGRDPVARATSPMGMAMPDGGSESRFGVKERNSPITNMCLCITVNPDQLLAAYAAARARSAGEGLEPASPIGQTTSPSGLQPPQDSNVRQSVISDASVYSTAGPSDGSRK